MNIGLVYIPNRDVSILVQIPHLKKLKAHKNHEKLLCFYMHLMYLCSQKEEGTFNTTMDNLAGDMGVHRRSIIRWKNILVNQGMLITTRQRYSTIWQITTSKNSDVTLDNPDVTLDNQAVVAKKPLGMGKTTNIPDNPTVTSGLINTYITPIDTNYMGNGTRDVQVTSYLGNETRNVQETNSLGNVRDVRNEKIRQFSNQAPQLPIKVSETLDIGHEFPYIKTSAHISGIWYWAVRRYNLYGLDMSFTKEGFKTQSAMFSRNVAKKLGNSWERIKHFVNWYVLSQDKFIMRDCSWGFEYMVSNHCVNKYLAEFPKLRKMMITTDEERHAGGRWIKS